jgi:hypothetical protein
MENIYNITIPFYKKQQPELFENVLVIFTKHNESYIEAKLLEYDNIYGIMTYDSATRKKKVYDWKKEIPLNKQSVATVEQIISKDYVQLSTLNLKKDNDLMKPFINNKILVNIIKKLCKKINIEFNDFWTKIIYNIKETNLELIRNDSEEINKLIIYNYPDLSHNIVKELNKLLNNKILKFETKIQLLTNNINNTISLLHFIQSKYEWLNPIKYNTDSIYIFESTSENSSINNHNEIIQLLNEIIDSYNVELFIISEPKIYFNEHS